MKRSLLILLICLASMAGATPDWQSYDTQTARDEWVLWDANGAKILTGEYAGFIAGADSSLSKNRAPMVYSAACSCWVIPDTMSDGSQIRDGRMDIRRRSGADSLIVDNALIHGRRIAKDAVDSMAVDVDAIYSPHIKDETILAADIDTNAVTASEIATEAVGAAEVSTAARIATTALTLSDTLHVEGDAALEDSLLLGRDSQGFLGLRSTTNRWVTHRAPNALASNYGIIWPSSAPTGLQVLRQNTGNTALEFTSTLTLTGLTVNGTATITNTGTDSLKVLKGYARFKQTLTAGGGSTTGRMAFRENGFIQTIGPQVGLPGNSGFYFPPGDASATHMILESTDTGGAIDYTDSPTLQGILVGDASTDSARVEPPLHLGGSGSTASLVWHDGSGNTSTWNAPAMAGNTTSNLPAQMIWFTYNYTDTTSWYRQAYYIAGLTSSHKVACSWNYDPAAGSSTLRVPNAFCKTDSLIVTTSGTLSSVIVSGMIWLP